MSKVWRLHIWQKYTEKLIFINTSMFSSIKFLQTGFLTLYFTTGDSPLSNPYGPLPTGNPKSLNFPYVSLFGLKFEEPNPKMISKQYLRLSAIIFVVNLLVDQCLKSKNGFHQLKRMNSRRNIYGPSF